MSRGVGLAPRPAILATGIVYPAIFERQTAAEMRGGTAASDKDADSMSAADDKDAIRELLATYCFHLDDGEFEQMAALFTEDGVWETAFGTGNGRAGIMAQAKSIAGTEKRPRRAHLTTNIVITLDGESAGVQSNWTVVQNTKTGPGISSGGAYFDHVVKQNGKWLFKFRRIDRYIAEGLLL
jgi:uncharacterized protein (TIGR02246 family)